MHGMLLSYLTRRDNLGITKLFFLSAIRFTLSVNKKRCLLSLLLQHCQANLHEISAAAGFDVVRNFLVCVWLF
jgi:hypothetical protein